MNFPRQPRIHLPRRTVRLRLTVLYGGLFLLSSAGLLAITYLLVEHRFAGPVLIHKSGRPGAVSNQLSQACAPVATSHGLGPSLLSPCVSFLRSQAAQQRAQVLNQLLAESGIALAIMAVISIVLGWLMAGRVLRPLRTITAAAQHISASNLYQRLALAGPDDELKELGDTFDGLLGRLAASFDAQRQFAANASHELRTPLTRQRTLLEVALGDPDATVGSLRGTCQRVLATSAEQEMLIEALLTLARSERGLDRQEPLDLRQEADRRGLHVTAALDEATAWGDPRLAGHLLGNLLDNAVRHNVTNGWIKLTTGTRAGRAVLTVGNSGPVIPHMALGQLFQPFHRLGGERTGRGGVGLGLGLAIVHAVAIAHNATITAHSRPNGGLDVEVDFPAAGRLGSHVRPSAAVSPVLRRPPAEVAP